MNPDEVRKHPPRLQSEEQRERYFEDGYLLLEGLLTNDLLGRLIEVTNSFVEASREVSESGYRWVFDRK